MRPEDMNTLNANGTAYDGNRGAVIVAIVFGLAIALAVIVNVLSAIF